MVDFRMHIKMPFGKYRGKTMDQIYAEDPGYLRWMVREGIVHNSVNYSTLAEDCLKAHATKKEERQEPEEKQEQEQKTIYRCAECDLRRESHVFLACPFCGAALCGLCLVLHDAMHTRAREQAKARTESAQRTEYAYANRARQEEKEKERARENAKRYGDFLKEEMFGGGRASNPPGSGSRWGSFNYHNTNGNTSSAPPLPPAVRDAFSVLGLAPSVTPTLQDVKHAFRLKAKQAHPDTGGSAESFKKLNAAYQTALQQVR